MEYLITLLEGIITFISPCILPLLPIYISYFAGNNETSKGAIKSVVNALCFVLGFTLVFTTIGALSGVIGNVLKEYRRVIDIILGVLMVIFGINFMNVITIPFINKTKGIKLKANSFNPATSFSFGVIFSLTWSPCIGAFLGSALSLIVIHGNFVKGITLMITYCLGLGIPFVISTLIIDKLKNTFSFIKAHYNVISKICGIFLCIIGILMITGLSDKYFNLVI